MTTTLSRMDLPLVSVPRLEHMRIAVSYYCSLRCQHCYVPELNRTKYRTLLEHSQLEVEQIHDFIDLLIERLRLKKISITGGEAMLKVVWPRTQSVLRHALDRGLTVQLNTSGSGQITMAEVAEVCQTELDQLVLQLSLDGTEDETVDKFRGHRNAMALARKTLYDAAGLGIRIQTRFTMTEENRDEAVPCYDLVSDAGAEAFHIKPMFAAGTARDNTDILIRQRERVADKQRELLDRSVGNDTRLGLPEPVYVRESEFPAGANAHVIKCECGGGAGYLAPNGDVYPCTYLVGLPGDRRWVIGNIKDSGFDFVQTWSKPDTYSEFRYDDKDGCCTAQNIASQGLGMELGPLQLVDSDGNIAVVEAACG